MNVPTHFNILSGASCVICVVYLVSVCSPRAEEFECGYFTDFLKITGKWSARRSGGQGRRC